MFPRLDQSPGLDERTGHFLQALKSSGFRGDIHDDYSTRLISATDNSIYQVLPEAVLFPKDAEDITRILELSSQDSFKHLCFSPRGGGTGTNGQSLTQGIIIDTSRFMNQVLEINTEEAWARVQPGVILDQLNEILDPTGLFFAPSLSPSNRATIGGMANTDACGKGSRIYGRTSNHIHALDVILIDGSQHRFEAISIEEAQTIASQNNLIGQIYKEVANYLETHQDNIAKDLPKLRRFLTGYNLNDITQEDGTFNLCPLICGSEGTLGIISELKIHLSPKPKHKRLVAVHYGQFDDALRGAKELVEHDPAAIETIDDKIIHLARSDNIWHKIAHLLPEDPNYPIRAINLIEFTAVTLEELDTLIQDFCKVLDQSIPERILRYTIAKENKDIAALWDLRKKGVGLLGNVQGERRPVPFVEDTAVPPECLADYIQDFRKVLEKHGLDYGMFGHVDVGCLHVRPALDIKQMKDEKLIRTISDEVCALVQKYNGVMWAEHGRGYRSEYTERFFGSTLFQVLRQIKTLFDPNNRLNPGKIVTPLGCDHDVPKLDSIPMRGQFDRQIPETLRKTFSSAIVCNGNGACFNYDTHDVMCPSMKATNNRIHSPKGRAGLMREWLRLASQKDTSLAKLCESHAPTPPLSEKIQKLSLRLKKNHDDYDFSHEVYESMQECLSCKACSSSCPIKVDIPDLKSRFLEQYHRRYFRPIKDYLVAFAEPFAWLSSKSPSFFNMLLENKTGQKIMKDKFGMVDAPKASSPSLKQLCSQKNIEITSFETLTSSTWQKPERGVILLQDTFTSFYEAPIVIHTIELLKKLGHQVILMPWFSNGKPKHIKGFLNAFRKDSLTNISRLQKMAQSGLPIVGIEPSMVLTYREEYPQCHPQAEIPNVLLLQEWLQQALNQEEISKSLNQTKHHEDLFLLSHCSESTSYPASAKTWQSIFEALGFHLKTLSSGCCGMAGTFGHETAHLERSKEIFSLSWQKHIDHEERSTASFLATGFSCRHQVERLLERQFQHPCQWLNEHLDA